MLEAGIGFLILIALVLLRVPIALGLMTVGFFGFTLLNNPSFEDLFLFKTWKSSLSLVSRHVLATIQNYELSVIPLFILMGNIVAISGISQQLYKASNAFLGHFKGGLSMATVVACGAFSAICGSSLATAATMSKVALPEMRKYNYHDSLAAASIAAGGTLGILIPPSVILVIYGVMTQQSIRELFAAGLIPGILGILMYLLAVRWTIWRNPNSGPAGEKTTFKERMTALKGVWATCVLFIIVMFGIYFGIFTPTEAAGIGAFGALIISLLMKKINLKSFIGVLHETSITTVSLFSILICAIVFADFVDKAGMSDTLIDIIKNLEVSPLVVIMLILFIYIILGMVFESLSMMLLTVPVFFPLVSQLGFDLVWFGIIVVVVIEISLITPPIGLNVFVLSSVVPDIKTRTVFKGLLPFWIIDIIRLLILTFIPTLTLYLPKLLYG